jgi:hypothetical protein
MLRPCLRREDSEGEGALALPIALALAFVRGAARDLARELAVGTRDELTDLAVVIDPLDLHVRLVGGVQVPR